MSGVALTLPSAAGGTQRLIKAPSPVPPPPPLQQSLTLSFWGPRRQRLLCPLTLSVTVGRFLPLGCSGFQPPRVFISGLSVVHTLGGQAVGPQLFTRLWPRRGAGAAVRLGVSGRLNRALSGGQRRVSAVRSPVDQGRREGKLAPCQPPSLALPSVYSVTLTILDPFPPWLRGSLSALTL